MKLEFWGVRGTAPVSGRDKNKYGGHTLCASVITSQGEWIIIDSGTGIIKLGDSLLRRKKDKPLKLHLFLTHFHLDHIIGLPFFAPLYSPRTTLNFYSAYDPEQTERHLNGLMAGKYFPVKMKDTPSRKIYKKIPEKGLSLGDVRISTCPLHHPQGSVAYKIEENDKRIVFATDTEHGENRLDKKLVSFARGVDILIYDAMFTPKEYESGKRGWGHSTWLEGTRVALKARVRRLYLSHFNLRHSDDKVDAFISLARQKFPRTYGAQENLRPSF